MEDVCDMEEVVDSSSPAIMDEVVGAAAAWLLVPNDAETLPAIFH